MPVRLHLPLAEPWVRLGSAAVVFAAMACWELALALYPPRVPRGRRWLANLALAAIDAAAVRIALPAGLVGAALWFEARGWGVLSALGMPRPAEILLAVVALDLAVYLQHVLFHAVPWLWRFHRVHHADHDVDVSTGLRFHPIEVLLSTGIKLVVVAALGVPAVAALAFEVLLNGTSIFNHANVGLPAGLDRMLRLVLVTPDMHRIHHSVEAEEQGSNFGFSLAWWDRMLGTYRAEAAAGRRGLRLGVAELEPPRPQPVWWLLALPWRRLGGA